jgi:hypothetical protein
MFLPYVHIRSLIIVHVEKYLFSEIQKHSTKTPQTVHTNKLKHC